MRTGPPLDSELKVLLGELPQDAMSLVPGTIAVLRQAMAEQFASDEDMLAAAAVRIDRHTAVGVARDVELIVVSAPPGAVPRPGILHIHGGGLVAGGHRSGMVGMAELAVELGCVVVSVDYRLAPECPYPAALDDCVTALKWTISMAAALGIDPERIAVWGGSAGGGIAAGLALRCRNVGGVQIRALLLLQPMLDDRNETPSTYEIDDDIFWDRTSNATGWTSYIGHLDVVPPDAAPARADDLVGMPPTFIEVGDVDIFRDECLDFAARLSHAAVSVELHMWPGGFHGFDGWASTLSRQARDARIRYLRRALEIA